MNYVIRIQRDSEAQTWIATSEDVKGLVLEGETVSGLVKHIHVAVPELVKLNRQEPVTFLKIFF